MTGPPVLPTPDPALLNRLEAVLLVSELPLSEAQLLQLLPDPDNTSLLQACLTALARRHAQHSLYLRQTATGWQLAIRPDYAPAVGQLWPERPQRLSAALLETLSVIAYRQPVTRADIEQIRGVALSSGLLRTLFERGWIREHGHREVPGRPALLVTTARFLDDFGLASLAELPPLALASSLDPAADQATSSRK